MQSEEEVEVGREKSSPQMRKSSQVGHAANQKQYEVNCQINEVIAEVLDSHNVIVKAA